MEKKVGVLLIHGMGDHSDDFAHDTIQHLRERILGRGLNHDQVAWESVHWQPVLADREQQLWVDLSAGTDLHWGKLRRFLLNAFGSATSYLTKDRSLSYRKIYTQVHRSMIALQERLGNPEAPLVILAHSVGAMIISDYIWDRQRKRSEAEYGATPFLRMETLAGMATFGVNLPLFAVDLEELVAITFPPPLLAERLKRQAKWLNLYDPADVLGWPLKPLSPSYAQAVTQDLPINVESLLTSWNPATHATAYWGEENFTRPVADLIAGVLELSQS